MSKDIVKVARAKALVASGVGKTVRQSAGLSLAELGQAIGVDPSTVYRWETRERHPQGERAVAYADLLRRLMEANS